MDGTVVWVLTAGTEVVVVVVVVVVLVVVATAVVVVVWGSRMRVVCVWGSWVLRHKWDKRVCGTILGVEWPCGIYDTAVHNSCDHCTAVRVGKPFEWRHNGVPPHNHHHRTLPREQSTAPHVVSSRDGQCMCCRWPGCSMSNRLTPSQPLTLTRRWTASSHSCPWRPLCSVSASFLKKEARQLPQCVSLSLFRFNPLLVH